MPVSPAKPNLAKKCPQGNGNPAHQLPHFIHNGVTPVNLEPSVTLQTDLRQSNSFKPFGSINASTVMPSATPTAAL